MKKTILDYLKENHQYINASCNGNHQCGQCKVKLLNRKPDLSETEKKFLSHEEIDNSIILACFHDYQKDDEILVFDMKMDILDTLDEKHIHSCFEGNGLIIDIGTTTIVMKWIGNKGECLKTGAFINPQVSFGGDVISRINESKKHFDALCYCLIHEIEQRIIKQEMIINQMIVCGNTTMTHFFIKEKVETLGKAPFHVLKKEMQKISSYHIFKNINYEFPIITFPHISAFVGGDIVAGIYASDLDQSLKKVLFVDLGTNGEMVLGNKEGFIVTSSAAGPAFEGVGISCGGSSINGAISHVSLQPFRLEVIGSSEAQCICGSGLISLFSELVRNQKIDELGHIVDGDEIVLSKKVKLNSEDISHFQLSKAAIETGIKILLENNETDTLYIAGGFGTHLDINDLKNIRVIPQTIKNIKYLGNSAINGCYKLLMSQDFNRVNEIIEKSQSIDLSKHPDFEDTFIESMYFYDEDY